MPKLSDPQASALFRQGIDFLNQGAVVQAIYRFLEAGKRQPGNPDILSRTGITIMDYGETRLKEGRDMLSELKDLRKGVLGEEEGIAYSRSLFLVEPYQFDSAETLLKGYLKSNPKNFQALAALGECELARGRFGAAMAWFKQALENNPKGLRAMWGNGLALLKLGKKTEAQTQFDSAYSADPESAANNVRMGKMMVEMGKPIAASNYFNQALRIDKDCVGAHLGIIPLLLANNGDMSARAHLQAVRTFDPENPEVYLNEGLFNEMRGNLTDAVANYEAAVSLGAGSIDARYRLARIYCGVGTRFPGNPFSNEDPMVVREYRLYYDADRALTLLREVQALSPNHPDSAFISETIERLETQVANEKEINK